MIELDPVSMIDETILILRAPWMPISRAQLVLRQLLATARAS